MSDRIRKLELAVEGMHCAACELTIEKNLCNVPGVENVDAKLGSKKVFVEYSGDESIENIVPKLSHEVEDNGYKIVLPLEKKKNTFNLKEYLYGAAAAAVLILIYLGIERLGLLSFGTGFELNFLTAFFIGILASLSTCAAVVGGIVLSISAEAAKQGKAKTALLSFHLSRIVSFALLGFALGLLGQSLTSNPNFNLIDVTFWMKTLLAVVLFLLAINLLDIFPNIAKYQFRTPKNISKKLMNFDRFPPQIIPAVAGFVSFFLPCGFTQSIQLSALVSADPVRAMTLLFAFALGTFPILALISFASTNIAKSLQSGIFYKMAGFLILALAFSEAFVAYRIMVGF